MNTIPKIRTKADPIAEPVVEKWLKERGMGFSSGYDNWALGYENAQTFQCFGAGHFSDYKEVPIYEFIYELGKIPVKQKEITIDILPWKVIIKGDKVDIGCRKDKNLQAFKDTVFNDFSSNRGEKGFYGQTVSFSRQGFYVGADFVSWETFDKFVVELKK